MQPLVYGIIGTLFGIFIKAVFDKISNRKYSLVYNVFHSSLGSSETHPIFGLIEVLYNKHPVRNLFLSNLEITNNGYRDIDLFELNITCDTDSQIIISTGRKVGALKDLELSKDYIELLNTNNPLWLKRRDYLVPVFNRNDKIEISMLTTNLNGTRPVIFANIEKSGYSIKAAKNISRIMGEPLKIVAILGIVLSVILVLIMMKYIENSLLVPILALIIGLFAQIFGIILIKTLKLILQLLSK